MLTCPICGQSSPSHPAHCPTCGCPIQKLQDVSQQAINPTTITKAITFYQTKIPTGAWFELKKIGHKYYLYGRLRVGAVKKSQYRQGLAVCIDFRMENCGGNVVERY